MKVILTIYFALLASWNVQSATVERTKRQTIDSAVGGPNCKCVKFLDCRLPEEDGTEDIVGDLDTRIGLTPVRNGFANQNGLVPNGNAAGCTDFLDVCCNDPIETPINPPNPVTTPVCGRRNPNGVFLKVVDTSRANQAQYGEFPWMATLLTLIPGTGAFRFVCGGSLIAPNVVLTGAHCVAGKQMHELTLRVGEWDTASDEEFIPHQDFSLRRVITHPDFNRKKLYNNFALLVLDRNVEFNAVVDTICLPNRFDTFDHERCWASGWGKDGFEGKYAQLMKKVDLPVVSHGQCQQMLRDNSDLSQRFNLHQSFTCAGGEPGKDTCKGDGGSPLVCRKKDDPNRYVQVGIVSWGKGCGVAGRPGVYASVTYAVDWIQQQLSFI